MSRRLLTVVVAVAAAAGRCHVVELRKLAKMMAIRLMGIDVHVGAVVLVRVRMMSMMMMRRRG